MSTLHVKPLSGPGNLAVDEPHEHSESCTTPSPTARLLWHLQRALHQAACLAGLWSYRVSEVQAAVIFKIDVSTLLEGEGVFMMIALLF